MKFFANNASIEYRKPQKGVAGALFSRLLALLIIAILLCANAGTAFAGETSSEAVLAGPTAGDTSEETVQAGSSSDESLADSALAGAESGQDVTIHFGDEEGMEFHVHINPETEAQALAGMGAEESGRKAESATEGNGEETSDDTFTVTYVDQFGDPIGESYMEVQAPDFDEDGVLDLTATDDYKPVADFAVWQEGTSKAIQYTYVRARVNYRTITAIRKGAPQSVATEEEKATGDDTVRAQGDTEAESGSDKSADTEYFYTYGDDEWRKLEKTDSVLFVFNSGKQRVYNYEDDNIKVTATLQHAWAIPDGAQLKVVQITPQSSEYNYEAYMEALNDRAPENEASQDEDIDPEQEQKRFDEENTLLYDFAFIAVKYDEEGNAIEGSDYEYEPADGTVALSVEFKESQLTKDLNASAAEDIMVMHLPLTEQVKSEVDTTAQATGITSSDILVENVSLTANNVSLEEGTTDSVSFKADSFSTFVFATDKTQDNFWPGSRKFTMGDILAALGDLTNYAVVADVFDSNDHVEGNIRVKELLFTGNGLELNAGGNVETYNTPDTLKVTKTVENADRPDNTFFFRIVDETTKASLYNDYSLGGDANCFSLTTSLEDGIVSGSITFTRNGENNTVAAPDLFQALDAKHQVQVYELTSRDGEPIPQGGKNGDMTVSYYTEDSISGGGEIAGNNRQNYIGDFVSRDGSLQSIDPQKMMPLTAGVEFKQGDGNEGRLQGHCYYDDKICLLNTREGTIEYDPDLKQKIQNDIKVAASVSSLIATAYNGDTGTVGSRNFGSDLNVINVDSKPETAQNSEGETAKTATLTKDLESAHFASNDSNSVTGHANNLSVIRDAINNGEYLLININVDPSCSEYVLDGQNLYYGGVSPQAEYSQVGSHVIYNFVTTSDDHQTFTPYRGKVTVKGDGAGLILAPYAEVDQNGGMWIGELIGGTVKHGGPEIHKITTISGDSRKVTVDIVNTRTKNTFLAIRKQWLDMYGAEIAAPVSSIVVQLTRTTDDTAEGPTKDDWTKTVILNASNNWYYSTDELDAADAEGRPYYYYAEELNGLFGSYEITYENNGIQTGADAVITVKNTKMDTEIEVEKVWEKTTDIPNKEEISFDLYYMLGAANTEGTLENEMDLSESTEGTLYGTYSIKAEDGWKTKISELPLYERSGDTVSQCYYYVKEHAVDRYIPTYTNNRGISTGKITITNKETETTSFRVEKKWFRDGSYVGAPNKSITFDLYRMESSTPPGVEETETSTAQSADAYTELALDVKWGNHSAGTLAKHFDAVHAGDTITITVVAPCDDINGNRDVTLTPNFNNGVYDQLYSKAVGYESKVHNETVEYVYSEYYKVTRQVYTYTFHYKVPAVEKQMYNELSRFELQVIIPDNYDSHDDIEVSDAVKGIDTPMVQSQAEAQDGDECVQSGIVLSNQKGWYKVFDYLPVKGSGSSEETVYYTYYVVERNGEDYSVTYENNGGVIEGVITINNKIPDGEPSYTSINVTKKWEDNSGNDISGSKGDHIVFQLRQVLHHGDDDPIDSGDPYVNGNLEVTGAEGSDGVYTLTPEQNSSGVWVWPTATISNLPVEVRSEDDVIYTCTYYIYEEDSNENLDTRYQIGNGPPMDSCAGTSNGATVTIINKEMYYALPATGGVGTRRIYLVSIMLIVLAGVGLILVRRRREMTR